MSGFFKKRRKKKSEVEVIAEKRFSFLLNL